MYYPEIYRIIPDVQEAQLLQRNRAIPHISYYFMFMLLM